MVFRNGLFFLANDEKWYLGSERIEMVKRYVYLGFTFTTAISTTQSSKQLALKGKKAAFDMVRPMNKLEMATKDIFKNFLVHKFSLPYCMRPKSGTYWSHTIILKKFMHMRVNNF